MPLSDYDPIINQAADEWNLDPKYLRAVLMQENAKGDPRAVSKAGAIGLGQLMPDTAKAIGVDNPYDPVQSIYGAAKYLNTGLNAEGTAEGAALYYHGGPGWRQNFGPESQGYVPGVAKNYASLTPPASTTESSTQPARIQVASATPKTATDATPGGDDPLSLLPPPPAASSTPAASASTPAATKGNGKAAPAANDDDPLKLLPPAPKPAGATTAATTPPYDVNPSAVQDPNASIATLGPEATGPLDVHKMLAPAPDTEYGNILPYARDTKTGEIRWLSKGNLPILPNLLRMPLYGATEPIERATTVNPTTGTFGVTPEVEAAVQAFGGRPLEFSHPLSATPLIERQAPLTPEFKANALSPEARAAGAAAPAGPVSPTGIEPPPPASAVAATASGPAPAGAQVTPSYEAIFTPKEEAAYRATAEGQKLLEPQIIGERDNNSYIPGVTPNNAEIEQTVEAARDMKALGIQTPEASQLAKETAQANNTTRKEYSLNTEKTPVDIINEETAREDDINRDAAKVFADGNVQGDVSTQPLIDQMRGEMNLRRNRQNSALQSVYGGLIDRLTGEDGNAVTMHPEEAWSLRQDIDRMTDKLSTTGTDAQARNQRRVAGNLNGVSDTLDNLIEAQAPGYGDMLKTYKAHSDKIREMEVLQGLTSRISTGPQGNLSFSAMQRFMKNVVDSRATGSQDLNPYKSISPETMQRLWNLRDDLRRSAGASELARAAGSDTTQNILDVMRNWGKLAGQSAAHAGALHFFGPAGPIALRMMQEATAPYRIARRTQRNISAMQQMLNPPTPLRIPPGQENPLAPP